MALANCRVVLVGTQIAANLGAAARVMRNFGAGDLVLVAPEADPDAREARRLSTHGESILDEARAVATLAEALAGCVASAATSARTGKLIRGRPETPREVAAALAREMAAGKVALVFGPERSGLTDAELVRCDHLIHIPAEPSYPALNLAQAVAICLYELRCACQEATGEHTAPARAAVDELDRSLAHLQEALEAIHFLYGPKAHALLHALRQLIVRARPTAQETRLLHGLARQILWFARRHDQGMS